jgi:hypothetical protein
MAYTKPRRRNIASISRMSLPLANSLHRVGHSRPFYAEHLSRHVLKTEHNWQQFGNNIGHVSPMSVQCSSGVVVMFAPKKQVLFTSFQHVPNATLMEDAPDSKSGGCVWATPCKILAAMLRLPAYLIFVGQREH